MKTIKNCYSPAGMGFTTSNLDEIHLRDCPACRYGTIDLHEVRARDDGRLLRSWWECADCKAMFRNKSGKPSHRIP